MTLEGTPSPPKLRLFGGGVATETNVFSPLPTGLRDYAIARSDEAQDVRRQILGGSTFARYAQRAESEGAVYSQGFYAFAMPAGITTRVTYEALRHSLLTDLQRALPLDGVLLTLHGAMVADGYDDCETDLLQAVRQLVGGGAKIGVLLDLHCDLPEDLIEAADVIVAFKEYPHVDIDQRADELAALVIAAARREINPTMATFDCRMIGVYPTPPQPMRKFVERMKDAEQDPGVLSVSLGHGFPWGDAPAIGTRMLVVADDDGEKAEALAAELGREFFSLRHEVNLRASSMTQALDHAFSFARSRMPIVIADVSDNAGGGAASDSTFVLRELLERDVEDVALALLWDPVAVRQAFAAGEDAYLTLRLGGKMGPASGQPLDLDVRVRGLVEGLVQRWPQETGSIEVPCGDCACITCGGIDVIVSSVRQQVLGLEVFTDFGIDIATRKVLVVKSLNHFHAAFAPIAAEVIYMSGPGALILDPTKIPYVHVDTRKFPWMDDPWGSS